MFDYFRGTLASKTPTRIVIDIGGIGYVFGAPLSTTEALPSSGEVKVWAFHYLREDLQQLYAFATLEERELFTLLQKVNGIGPRLALAILSRARVAQIARAITDGELDFLKRLKGVGPKTALRLVTELRDKLEHLTAAEGSGTGGTGRGAPLINDAVQALEVLGCPTKSAESAVAKAMKQDGDMNLESLVKAALKIVWPN